MLARRGCEYDGEAEAPFRTAGLDVLSSSYSSRGHAASRTMLGPHPEAEMPDLMTHDWRGSPGPLILYAC
jgi:hypothetical protein